MVRTFSRSSCSSIAAAISLFAAANGSAAPPEKKAVFAIPGIPPVFAGVIGFVGEKEGFFKKYGVDVAVRPFESGAAAARAVAAGDVDIALSPTPLIVNQVSNSDVKLVAIYGLEHPDWLVGSTDAKTSSCKDLRGKAVGVESIGGARSLALKEMLHPCGLKLEDVQQIPLSTNVDQAMIAGQLQFGVLHTDDIPRIEAQLARPLQIITSLKESTPTSHYLLAVVNKDKLASDRPMFVHILAGLLEAHHFMRAPANARRVAELAAPTGRPPAEAEKALKTYLAMEYWPNDHPGLSRKNLESIIEKQVALGGIRPGKKPVTLERLTDPSVWQEAATLTKGR